MGARKICHDTLAFFIISFEGYRLQAGYNLSLALPGSPYFESLARRSAAL